MRRRRCQQIGKALQQHGGVELIFQILGAVDEGSR